MPDALHCIRCGSDDVIPRVRVVDRGDSDTRRDLQVEVQRRPNAVIFKRAERSNLWAQVCGACGYTELYADAPRALHAAYLQADASPSLSALRELELTREALADSQIRLHELEEKLDFVERLLERDEPVRQLPKPL
jgi:predicted nucleic-acid-binding Zn-ribbon protein